MDNTNRLGGQFDVEKKLGSGSFGEVFLGRDIKTGNQVAIKLEKLSTKHPQLLYESKIYRVLAGGEGIPLARWFGVERKFNILVVDLLGKSLEDLFNYCKRRFTPNTVLRLGEQMIARVEYMHNKNFLHRDIKPDNFLIGKVNQGRTVFVIDFGLSKRYRHHKTHQHMPYREGRNLIGTPRYASCNNHLGLEQSRRDDMESIAYVLVYFARGILPWQGLKADTKELKYAKIRDSKLAVNINQLCKDIPEELKLFLEVSRKMAFDEQPKYQYFRNIFIDAVRKGKYGNPNRDLDWIERHRRKQHERQQYQQNQHHV